MMVKLRAAGREHKLVMGLAFAILCIVLILTSPWYIPWFIWTQARTHFVSGTLTPYYAVDSSSSNYTVPKIIHQTWKDNNIPQKWQAARQSCIDLHPDYEYKLWTDASADSFVQQHYPLLAHTYMTYPYVIQRADAIRYAVLHHYGGIYIDLDIVCLHPLDFLRSYGLVLPKTWPVGFSNDFIVGAPGHPFLQKMVDNLPSSNWWLFSKYATVMFSTGPMFVTAQANTFHPKKDLAVLPDAMYGKYVASPDPLFQHLHGSSWHGDDAKSVLWFLRHPIVIVSVVLFLLSVLAVYMAILRSQAARQLSMLEAENPLNKMC